MKYYDTVDSDVLLIQRSGPTGSGKTELKRLAIEAITQISLANPGKKGSKIGVQVSSAEVCPIDHFTCSSSPR